MNREQWQQKRRQVGSAQAAFGTDRAEAILPATSALPQPRKVVVPIRRYHGHDAKTCCEWSIMCADAGGSPLVPTPSE